MTDQRPDDETDPPPPTDPELAAVERRAFLRQLTGEAVVTSARLAGLSMAVRRGLFAAAESATREVDPKGPEPDVSALSATTTVEAAEPVPPVPAPPDSLAPPAPPMAAAALAPAQEAFLASATTAILGSNDAAGAPHLTASRFHWDGTVVHLPSDLFAARVERIASETRVSVLIADAGPDAWVSINGNAVVVSGDAVEAVMLTILRKDMTEEEADRAWTEMRSSGNPVVIEVRPSRYLWHLG